MQVLQLSRRINLNLSVRARGGAAACTDRPIRMIVEEANHMIWRRAPLVLAGLVMPLAANAQVMFDTTRVTCADYLAMSSADAPLFSAFLSGWFNPKTIAIATLLAASSAAPAGAQTIVDMSLISCDQFLKSPQERKDVLSAWMGGYYSAMKSLATIDARYVVRNSKKIATYCRTARNETLMSATQRNWR